MITNAHHMVCSKQTIRSKMRPEFGHAHNATTLPLAIMVMLAMSFSTDKDGPSVSRRSTPRTSTTRTMFLRNDSPPVNSNIDDSYIRHDINTNLNQRKTPLEIDVARPEKEVNPDVVVALAKQGLTNKAIAAIVGIHMSTLTRRFAEDIAQGKAESGKLIRSKIWDKAMDDNLTALLYLDKKLNGDDDESSSVVPIKKIGMVDAAPEPDAAA